MRPTSHRRDDTRPTFATCGAGYAWPSAILLKDRWDEVSCRACLEIKLKELSGEDEKQQR